MALPLPPIVAPPPVVTLSVPLVTVSVVVSGAPSASATDTPAIGSAVSSLTVCAPGTVLTGASFTGLTVIATVSMSVRGAVAGGDRERVGAVEVEIAGVGEAGERRVDLRRRCPKGDRGGAVAADRAPPPAVTLSVPLVTVSVVVSGGCPRPRPTRRRSAAPCPR